MNQHDLSKLAKLLLAGELSLEQFLHQAVGIASLGEAQVDLDRTRRCGFPEVIFAEGKTTAAMEKIFQSLLNHGADVLATRMSAQQAMELAGKIPLRALQFHRAHVPHTRRKAAAFPKLKMRAG